MSVILHRWDDIKRAQSGEIVSPSFVDLHLSDVCNQKCAGCLFGETHEHEVMSKENFIKACDILMDNGVKAFAFCGGGEPCVSNYLMDAWEHIRNRNGHFSMLTNGTLLTDELMSMMIRQGTFIRVSVEASDSETYCRYKHVPTQHWDWVMKNIARLVELKRQSNSDCSVGIKFSVSKMLRGLDHYSRAIEMANDLKVDRITFKAIRNNDEELDEQESIAEEMELHGALPILNPAIRLSKWIKKAPFGYVPQCYLNTLHTVMNWKGDLFLCCYYNYRREQHIIGNIFEQDFKDIWYSAEHKAKIGSISRKECHRVDCKFFHYHDDVSEASKVGSIDMI